MSKIISILLVMFCSIAFAQDAEFIWAEDDYNSSRILLSQHKNGVWQTAEKIVDDNNLNILPSIGSDTKGQRLAVWSTIDGAKSVLKYSIKRGKNWIAPQILTAKMPTNLAPVVLFDNNDICWVFWSANNGDDDDIYVSRLLKGIWTEPKMVNEDNNVPDILPEAGLDNAGNIWVSWQSLGERGYEEKIENIDSIINQPMQFWRTVTMSQVDTFKRLSGLHNSIQPPSFFRARSRATMYFPNDRRRPSKFLKGNID